MSRTCKDPRQMELHFWRFGRPGALWENYFISARPVMYADYGRSPSELAIPAAWQRPFTATDVRRAMDQAAARNLETMAAEHYRQQLQRLQERNAFLGMTWTTTDLESDPDPAAGSLTIADITRARAILTNLENEPNG